MQQQTEIWGSPLNCEFKTPEQTEPGSFAFVRKNHVHEGIDLYCKENTIVLAVENGIVSKVVDFTGAKTNSPWWEDTMAIFITGASGVVVYGELTPTVKENDVVTKGQPIGYIKRALKKDKGRPMVMLHLELRDSSYPDAYELFDWQLQQPKPIWLLDPTNKL
jgi:murein DD-endopeptidase MepM/ murein hydrolase activator NlpD